MPRSSATSVVESTSVRDSSLKASEYYVPVLGLIFLRFAEGKFEAARPAIEAKASARRSIGPSDYHAQRVLYLTEHARFSKLLELPEGEDVGKAVNDAMRSIEVHNPELSGVLPKTYAAIDNATIVSILRLINSYTKDLEGDALGLIYTSSLRARPASHWSACEKRATRPT